MEYTPEVIYKLNSNEILVFPTDRSGKHTKGLSNFCLKKFGAKYGQAKGLQGQCYGIIVADNKCKIELQEITEQIEVLLEYALEHVDKTFYISKLGYEMGYGISEIGSIFLSMDLPDNIILPKEYYDWSKI